MRATRENLKKLLNHPVKIKSTYMKKYIEGLLIFSQDHFILLNNYRYFNFCEAFEEYRSKYKYLFILLPSDEMHKRSYYNKLDILPIEETKIGEL